MSVVHIKIQSIEDAKAGKPLAEGLTEAPRVCKKFSVGILEGGMVSGATSLMFICQDGGKAVVGEMSVANFEMLIGAVRGAVERFGK